MIEILKLLSDSNKKQGDMKTLKEELDLNLLKGLCEESKSRIYGFILYTRRHANVVNFLQNSSYWDCLDDISGPNWPIFSVRPLAQGRAELKGGGPAGTIGMMISTWNEPNENRKVLDFFGLSESKDLPCFVGFIWDDRGVLQQFTWPINETSVDNVYSSLKRIVTIIAEAEERVSENLKSSEYVWEEVIKAVNADRSLLSRIKMMRAGSQAIQILSSAATLGSLI